MTRTRRSRSPPGAAAADPIEKERNMKLLRCTANLAGALLLFAGICLAVLRIRGISPYIVLSGSMEPGIPAGGIVFTDTGRRSPSAGEVITYRIGEGLVTHRVVRKEKNVYITKGDANRGEDPVPVEPSRVMGTVVFSLPFLGYLFSGVQRTPPSFLILIMIILSFFSDFHRNPITRTISRKGERVAGHAENSHEHEEKYHKGSRRLQCDRNTCSGGHHSLSDGF